MTKDDAVEHRFQELSCDDTQQQQPQQERFHVVLVDIKKAANAQIYCVEKPLDEATDELRFVALSYRWGELQEQLIDTHLGYIASITSFALLDFYIFCDLMRKEPDLKSIKYVWVDAICVDQTNEKRRKATIRQMSNIYDRATYILAVPNLHNRHLLNVSHANAYVLDKLAEYGEYIYHIIQGNTTEVDQLDNEFLEDIGVPKDQMLRQLVTQYNHCFMDDHPRYKLGTDSLLDDRLAADILVEELYNTSRKYPLPCHHPETQTDLYKEFNTLFTSCPKSLVGYWRSRLKWHGKRTDDDGYPILPWKNYVLRRNEDIAQVMVLLDDLIIDWSSRVWVISEYHIAKKSNNLKYWFFGLEIPGLPFFNFDFEDPIKTYNPTRTIFTQFHQKMTRQLDEKTFFEMMLNAKASKNEDRFYAILPQTKYKDKINQVANGEINTMVSVKLKLLKIMDTKDKWNFFVSVGAPYDSIVTPQILPTFATPKIERYCYEIFDTGYPLNVDLLNESAITIHNHAYNSQLYYYLQLIPKGYSVLSKSYDEKIRRYANRQKEKLCSHFQLDEHSLDIEFVRLSYFHESTLSQSEREQFCGCYVYLAGSFLENKWIFGFRDYLRNDLYSWNYFDNNDSVTVFNIY